MSRLNPDPYKGGHLFALVNHVTSLLDTEDEAMATVRALEENGVATDDIDIFVGEQGARRLDLSGSETQRRNLADATTLQGFAVSPGRVTAPASVIRSPADFAQMEPGTILVCPTTTPAWTPLFAQARGLVTDIGGILAHGSIVAREYGIPAVMGTGNATQRIASGQEITIDGSAGTVTLR